MWIWVRLVSGLGIHDVVTPKHNKIGYLLIVPAAVRLLVWSRYGASTALIVVPQIEWIGAVACAVTWKLGITVTTGPYPCLPDLARHRVLGVAWALE